MYGRQYQITLGMELGAQFVVSKSRLLLNEAPLRKCKELLEFEEAGVFRIGMKIANPNCAGGVPQGIFGKHVQATLSLVSGVQFALCEN